MEGLRKMMEDQRKTIGMPEEDYGKLMEGF